MREIWSSIPGPVKSNTVSPTVPALSREDEPRYSLHASAQYREDNEDLIFDTTEFLVHYKSFLILLLIPMFLLESSLLLSFDVNFANQKVRVLYIHPVHMSSCNGFEFLHHDQLFDVIIKASDYDVKNLIMMQKVYGLLELTCGQGDSILQTIAISP